MAKELFMSGNLVVRLMVCTRITAHSIMLGFVLSFVIEPVAGAYSDPFSVRPEAESSRQLRRLLRLSARRLHRWSIDGGSCGRYVVRGAAGSNGTGRGLLLLIEITRTLMDMGMEGTEAGGSSGWARRSIGVGGPLPIQWHDDEQAAACCCNPLARLPPSLLQCPPPPLHCRHG
uniref:Uncharacterized protein n=1 Tax=Oryza sativa subsp. japonica TaxID=39947 RepID=Q7Y1J9_ORYSJ|nr:hypothetical protein [Oryza sativa Japonica Group]AAS07091.1 hypothetical protein [Oryza sativa Japonica Group]